MREIHLFSASMASHLSPSQCSSVTSYVITHPRDDPRVTTLQPTYCTLVFSQRRTSTRDLWGNSSTRRTSSSSLGTSIKRIFLLSSEDQMLKIEDPALASAFVHQRLRGTSASLSCSQTIIGKLISLKPSRCMRCAATIDDIPSNGALRHKISAKQDTATSNGAVEEKKKKVAIVWFKHDLRMDDHLGLAASAYYDNVLPLFIFDPYMYAGWAEDRLASLIDAVADLRCSFQRIGSDLVIRRGRCKDILLALAYEAGATDIIAEEEIEHTWHDIVGSISASLSVESLSGQVTRLEHWRAPLYDLEGIEEIIDNYKEFTGMRCRILPPTDSPASLPSLLQDISPGVVPTINEFSLSINAQQKENPFYETLKAAQDQPAESLLLEKPHNVNGRAQPVTKAGDRGLRNRIPLYAKHPKEMPFNLAWEQTGNGRIKVELKSEASVTERGATGVLRMLKDYIRALEALEVNSSKGMYEHIMDLEMRPGSSFRAIFNRSLELGTLSRRRVYHEALKYERERGGGLLSPFGFSTFTAAAAIEDVKSIEWYEMIQRKSRDQGSENGFQVGSWRWRGYLIQYSTLGDEGPAVVLIHGFGAFWEHYRDNIRGLAEKGNRVWGLTMVGFGRSEKPPITYTELLLAELVRDFIVEVVKEPVALAGNSIGGYTTCVVAGLWPTLVRSLVLLNTAGQVVPNYKALKYRKPREKSLIAKRASHVLLIYLRHLSNRLLKRCYPNKTGRVDPWLQSEVMRPSFDPGSTAVLESIFHLHRPLPLNFYIDLYKGKVLVIQGTRDPLHNSEKRAAMMQIHCTNVAIRYLNAGHCPHDELPDEVNALIHDFLRCSSLELATDAGDSDSLSAGEDGAGFVNGNSQLIKSDWFSYFSR